MHASAKRVSAGYRARGDLTVYFEDLVVEPPVEAGRDMRAKVAQWSHDTFETAVEDGVVLTRELIDIVQRNVNARFSFLRKLARAKDLVEVLGLQAASWHNQFVAFTGQINELSALLTKAAADMVRGGALLTNLSQEKMIAQNQPFEIPEQLRELAKENVERARQLYLQFMEGVTQAMGAWSTPSSTGSSFNAVRERAMKLAKENAEAGFTLASEVAKAKDLQELVTLQSRYAQKQMKSYALQTQELGRLMTEALQTVPGSPPAQSHTCGNDKVIR